MRLRGVDGNGICGIIQVVDRIRTVFTVDYHAFYHFRFYVYSDREIKRVAVIRVAVNGGRVHFAAAESDFSVKLPF